jgi:hypothetical protein
LFIGNGAVNCLNLLLEIFELNARCCVGGIGRRITPVLNQAVAKGPEIIQWGKRVAADVCHFLNSIIGGVAALMIKRGAPVGTGPVPGFTIGISRLAPAARSAPTGVSDIL